MRQHIGARFLDRMKSAIGQSRQTGTSGTPAVEAAETHTRSATLTVDTPVAGEVVALSDVPDKVFASGALGMGVAVRPESGTIVSPIDGVVESAMPHAFGISGRGLDVLVHIGIDTVRLNGQHFTSKVAVGQRVRRGEVLSEVDLDGIRAAGCDPLTVVILTNSSKADDVVTTDATHAGDFAPLLTVTLSGAAHTP